MAKILVSDDDPQILQFVRMVLESAGHDVLTTAQASEVLGLARSEQPDVAVLDVMMPVSGYELLGALREDPRTAKIPILFLSGLGESADRIRGLREGADDYLVKPFAPGELVLRIEKLASWRRPKEQDRDDEEIQADDGIQRFGRYEVIEILGKGSMGTVYRGRDPRLEREVALKTIRLDAATTESRRAELLEMLRKEAITIARLSHPNIVAVYDMGDTKETAYVAMELVEGISLGDYLRIRGPMSPDDLIPIASCIARGLAQSHLREVVHRDVKPGNVLLGRDGAVKVSDFGLASVVSALIEDTTELSGTPGYVPPEVLRHQTYTQPGDLFGLGATLYEMLAGFHPLSGDSLRDTILNTMNGTYPPLTDQADVPEDLESLIVELLAIDPGHRPSADDTADRLGGMVASRGLHFDGSGLPRRSEGSPVGA